MTKFEYFGGAIVPIEDARLSITCMTIHYGILITPPITDNVLAGITRCVVTGQVEKYTDWLTPVYLNK